MCIVTERAPTIRQVCSFVARILQTSYTYKAMFMLLVKRNCVWGRNVKCYWGPLSSLSDAFKKMFLCSSASEHSPVSKLELLWTVFVKMEKVTFRNVGEFLPECTASYSRLYVCACVCVYVTYISADLRWFCVQRKNIFAVLQLHFCFSLMKVAVNDVVVCDVSLTGRNVWMAQRKVWLWKPQLDNGTFRIYLRTTNKPSTAVWYKTVCK